MRADFLLLVGAICLSACVPAPRGSSNAAKAPGLVVDHVPIAVRSQDDARRAYEALGFRLKPGRAHENGLRNAFAKFVDRSYLELITPERGATDGLTAKYVAFLARQEGGAFLSLRADSLDLVARALEASATRGTLNRYGAFNTFSFADSSLAWMFLIEYPEPIADAPELLDHPNTAIGIESVRIGGPRAEAFERLAAIVPGGIGGVQRSDDPRPLVSEIVVRVRDIHAVRTAVLRGSGRALAIDRLVDGAFVTVPPDLAQGITLVFVQRG